MDIIKNESVNVVTLAFKGRLDAASAPQAETAVKEFLGSGKTSLLLDLSGLEYISSAGLRVLLLANKALKQKSGALALCGVKGTVQEVLDVSGFTALFKVAASATEALSELNSPAT
jgi:anti-anti-sigma factor